MTRFANGIASSSPTGWYAIQFPSGNLYRKRFGSSLRAAQFAMWVFHVNNWNLLKDEGFRIVPCESPEDFRCKCNPTGQIAFQGIHHPDCRHREQQDQNPNAGVA